MLRQFAGMRAWALVCATVVLGAAGSRATAQTDAQAESLYVIEHLVVSVNAAADGSGERVGQIQSGDKVEVLERQGEQTRVRIASGNEGWVRTSYLSPSPPLREQLKARTEELEKVRQEKSKLEADLQTARKAANVAASEAAIAAHKAAVPPEVTPPPASAAPVEAPPAQTAQPESAADSAPSSPPPLFASDGVMPRRPSWIFALVTSVAALAVGFALGWRMLDRRIRAKYGGLRIY